MIEINELVISVADLTPERGEQLGQDVAMRLLDELPQSYGTVIIDSLDVRISAGPEWTYDQMINDISSHIRYQLLNR
jgi:hypothetical protein